MGNILLVEDELRVSSFITRGLEEEQYSVTPAMNGAEAFDHLKRQDYDLIILDIMLPDMSGFDFCRQIRQTGITQTPVLMLTALGSTDNVVQGLDAGADDYLVKPFQFEELLARTRALLRRKNKPVEKAETLRIADLVLNLDTKSATRSGEEITLTSTEYRVLECLLLHKNKVLSRTDLLEKVWNIQFDMNTNIVDVYINYLRNKVDKKHTTKLIHTVIGMGYILKEGT
jgi:two-component system, OmpR family, copper resistance phosphate regulon response regulator CusR